MKPGTENRVDISVCSNLLKRELAAVEVYRLAHALLACEKKSETYMHLEHAHQERVLRLREFVISRGGLPCRLESHFDRPRLAVLCAATLYGFEEPIADMVKMEESILEAYRRASQMDALSEGLKEALAGTMFQTEYTSLEAPRENSEIPSAQLSEFVGKTKVA